MDGPPTLGGGVDTEVRLRRLNYLLPIVVLSLAVSPAFGFALISNAGKPAYWADGSVKYMFNTGTSGYFDGGHDASGTSTDEFTPIREAFQTWANTPGLNLVIQELSSTGSQPSSDDGKNIVAWIKSGWSSQSFGPPPNALAVTLLSFDSGSGRITDADIYFNADNFQWAVVDSSSEYSHIDVKNIATHEIGHLLGIDHSSENIWEVEPELADATMFFASHAGDTDRRDLKIDDTRAINSLYGVSHTTAPQVTGASISYQGDWGDVQYRVTGDNFDETTSFMITKNSNDFADVVSKHRKIISKNEALVNFDIFYSKPGAAKLVAFNQPTQLSSTDIEVINASYNASSEESGGGGGCQLIVREAEASSAPSWASLLSLLVVGGVFFYTRRRVQAVEKARLKKHF